MMNYWGQYGSGMPFFFPIMGGIAILALWSILWKGLALWRAAKRGDTIWFIVFLFLNTLGILEIIYIFFVTGGTLSEFTAPLTGKHHAKDKE